MLLCPPGSPVGCQTGFPVLARPASKLVALHLWLLACGFNLAFLSHMHQSIACSPVYRDDRIRRRPAAQLGGGGVCVLAFFRAACALHPCAMDGQGWGRFVRYVFPLRGLPYSLSISFPFPPPLLLRCMHCMASLRACVDLIWVGFDCVHFP